VVDVFLRLRLGCSRMRFGGVLTVIVDCRLLHGIADVSWHRLAGAVVAAVDHSLAKRGDAGRAWVVADRRRLCYRIYLDLEHTGRPAQR
jgi:hypothetical protein